MERIEKSIDVHVPVRVAYDQWTQFEEFPRFMEGVREVRQMGDRHLHWVAEIWGKEKEWDAELTEQVPDRKIRWRSVSGTRNDGMVEFSPVSSNETRITVHMDYEPEGVVENVGDFLGATSSRVEGDLDRFKSFIESRGQQTGAWRGRIQRGHAVSHDESHVSSVGQSMSGGSSGGSSRRSGTPMGTSTRYTATPPAPMGTSSRDAGTPSGSSLGSTGGSMGTSPTKPRREASGSPSAHGGSSAATTGSEVGTSVADDMRDATFRSDFNDRYAASGGRYEDYEPAYRYGCSVRERYGRQTWAVVESDARRDWEQRQPGTWERFKEAVRRGWEEI